jgi:hypothetical protein
MDPRSAPARVRLRHRANQRTDVGGHSRSPHAAALPPHQSRKPRRCQAITVSGLTITSAVRHPDQMRESTTQSHRSVIASRARRVRFSTCSWCRNASTLSWSAARERTNVRSVWRSESSTGIMAEKRSHRCRQHQLLQ